MGLFEKIFGTNKTITSAPGDFFQTLNAYQPAFTSFSGSIYESDLVRAAIDAKARHISKLQVSLYGAAKPVLQTKMKHAPNEFQTWGQFLYRLSSILDVQNNAFIVPVLGRFDEITGIYPVLPSRCELVNVNGEVWVRYSFQNGKRASLPLKEVGIMTRYQYADDFFGSNNTALIPTMQLINIQNQGIQEGVKSAATYRFMATLNNFTSEEDLTRERQRFTRANFEADGGGMLLFPNKYKDIKQIDSKPFIVDDKQMEIIRTNVYNYFGINEDILQNKAFGDSWSAFYEGSVEPFAIQFSDVLSRMLFTQFERSNGSGVMATSNRLQYMSNADKLNMASQMADRGLMTRNELREMFNLSPLPDEIGNQLPIRGEYYNVGEEKPTETQKPEPTATETEVDEDAGNEE